MALEGQSGKLDVLIERMQLLNKPRSMGELKPPFLTPGAGINRLGSNQGAGCEESPIPGTMLHREPARLPLFHGPASSTYLISLAHFWGDHGLKGVNYSHAEADLAGYKIQSMLDNGEDEVGEHNQSNDVTASHTTRIPRESGSTSSANAARTSLLRDPLLELSAEEVISYIRRYDDMIGAQYPFLEIEVLIQQTKDLYVLIGTSSRSDAVPARALATGMDVPGMNILKMLLVVVLACEGASAKPLAIRLFEGLRPTLQEKQLGGVTNMKDLALLILAVGANP